MAALDCRGGVKTDARPEAPRPKPANQLDARSREQILKVCNEPPYRVLLPSQIVPRLSDEGRYLASESSFYRCLRNHRQLAHRGRTKPAAKATRPSPCCAAGPNEVLELGYLVLHADNDSPMEGATMLARLQRLGGATGTCGFQAPDGLISSPFPGPFQPGLSA